MRSVCVLCGSSSGDDPRYLAAARELGTELGNRGLRLVYGGASVGLMGAVADSAMDAGAAVLGVIPEHLIAEEVAHDGLTDLRVTSSMHERKALMAKESDSFIAMPGGFGTLEEVIEILTWGQLGLHTKPVGFLDVRGYYSRLISFFGHAVAEGFIRAPHLGLYTVDESPAALLDAMSTWIPSTTPKWADRV